MTYHLDVEHHETVTVDGPYEGVVRVTMPKLTRHPEGWRLELWHDEALQLAAAIIRTVADGRRESRERGPV